MTSLEKTKRKLEKSADRATRWIGSTKSLIAHSIFFAVCFTLPFLGITFDRMLLVLTTVVSLEAIYLAIFIQMTVNKNTADIEEIQEDVEEIQEDVDEIQKDVDEIQEDIEETVEDDQSQESKDNDALAAIQQTLKKLSEEIEQVKKK